MNVNYGKVTTFGVLDTISPPQTMKNKSCVIIFCEVLLIKKSLWSRCTPISLSKFCIKHFDFELDLCTEHFIWIVVISIQWNELKMTRSSSDQVPVVFLKNVPYLCWEEILIDVLENWFDYYDKKYLYFSIRFNVL